MLAGKPFALPVSWILQHRCPKDQINLAGAEGRARLVWRATAKTNCFLPGARAKAGIVLLSHHGSARPGLLTASAFLPLLQGKTMHPWCGPRYDARWAPSSLLF